MKFNDKDMYVADLLIIANDLSTTFEEISTSISGDPNELNVPIVQQMQALALAMIGVPEDNTDGPHLGTEREFCRDAIWERLFDCKSDKDFLTFVVEVREWMVNEKFAVKGNIYE